MAYQSTNQATVDPEFLKVIALLPSMTKQGPWIAGGSVRKALNGIPNTADYDIFFKNEEQRDEFMNQLEMQGATQTSENIFNHTFDVSGYKIQCIHHEYKNTLIQTLDRFDISICQFGYDGTNYIWSDEAGEDQRNMEFHFLTTRDPVYSMNRAFKYSREGYKPAYGEVQKLMRKVAKLPELVRRTRGEGPST